MAPDAAVDVFPLAQRVAASVDQPRFAMSVFVVFACLALALASFGLYAAISYSLSQRWRELGLRAAPGADREQLIRMVLREGLTRTLIGIGVGLMVAVLVARLMRGLLFGVSSFDPIAFAVAPAALLVVAVAACMSPALRAAATDPAETLRNV